MGEGDLAPFPHLGRRAGDEGATIEDSPSRATTHHPMLEILIPIAIIALLIAVNGLFVAAEFAIASVPHTRITQMAESGSSSAKRVLQTLRDPNLLNRYISTAQVGITLASLGLGMYGEETLAHWLEGPLGNIGLGETVAHLIAATIAVGFLTYLHVVLGEMIPKSLALQSAARTAVGLTWIMTWMERIFLPMTIVLNAIGNGILRLVGMPPPTDGARLVTSAELAYIVEESSEGGLLDEQEQLYIENILDFHDRNVGQVMTPRTRIEAIPLDADQQTALDIICEHRYSRYPVYDGDIDRIVGVLHTKDFARYITGTNEKVDARDAPAAPSDEEPFHLGRVLRPNPPHVPESKRLEAMLEEFRNAHTQVAVVIDEYGSTAGLVTLEDLVEEVVGEIQDEFDDEELAPWEELADNRLLVRGDLLLDEVNQHYEVDLHHEDADTVGGLIMAELGHIAEVGETIIYDDIVFRVESMEDMAIRQAILELPEPRSRREEMRRERVEAERAERAEAAVAEAIERNEA